MKKSLTALALVVSVLGKGSQYKYPKANIYEWKGIKSL